MKVIVLVIVIVVVLVAASLLGVVVARRLGDRWYQGTGREQWLQTARELSWRQRWTIGWAQALGRPVRDPKLVKAAEVRGRHALAAAERMQQPKSPMGRLRWFMAAAGILQMLVGVFNVSLGLRTGWVNVASGILLAAVGLWMPRSMTSGRKRVQRSLDGTLRTPPGTA